METIQVHSLKLTVRPWKMAVKGDDPFLSGFGLFFHGQADKFTECTPAWMSQEVRQWLLQPTYKGGILGL